METDLNFYKKDVTSSCTVWEEEWEADIWLGNTEEVGKDGRRGSGRKMNTELRSGWLFIAHKWDCHIITPPLQ